MFYQEKVINDILCVRYTPNGNWHQLTLEQLTKRVIDAEFKLNNALYYDKCNK